MAYVASTTRLPPPSFAPRPTSPREELMYLGDMGAAATGAGKRPPVFSCYKCAAHLALQDELISKSFSGREGKAYLFHSTVNTKCGTAEERLLLTGAHTVADLYCASCRASLGWTYIKAHEAAQKYKEGKFIMEKACLVKENGWTHEGWP